MSPEEYLLGKSSEEFARLTRQASLVETETAAMLVTAGVGAGQSVLEIGSGVGDVTMLAGRLVRPDGSVLGIEGSDESASIANARIAAVGNVDARIEVHDLDIYEPEGRFDALIGRFVLAYLDDPTVTLARLAKHVRPGGVVAFMEFDVRWIGSDPELPLMKAISRWILGAFEYRGVPVGLGSNLGAVFRKAGLPWPYMHSFQKASAGPGGVLWYMPELVRTIQADIIAGGFASEADIDIDTLEARLEAEAVSTMATVYAPRWVTAWARVPEAA